jgi:hypothetical protein
MAQVGEGCLAASVGSIAENDDPGAEQGLM